MGIAIILFTIAAMVALYVLVLPKSKDGKFNNKFLQWMILQSKASWTVQKRLKSNI